MRLRTTHSRDQRPSRRGILALAVLVGGLLLGAAAPVETSAQAAPRFDVVSVTHQPSGRLTAAVQVSDPKLLAPGKVSVVVDGVQRTIRVITPQERAAIPVVLAVDISGSMAGAPMVAAKDALRQLVAGLMPRDPVAVLGFSDSAAVRSAFGVDRSETLGAVQSMDPVGGTALYQAVEAASELAASGSGRGIVILVSDGEDTSGKSLGRETTLRSVIARGTPIYVFGVGSATDVPYLQSLATSTGGRYEAVADAEALRRVLADLGQTLGSSTTIEVGVPPLVVGSHTLLFRIAEKPVIERSVPFDVSNTGMLTATTKAPSDPAQPIALQVASPVKVSMLNLKLWIREREFPLSKTGEAMIDPWALAPGAASVAVVAANEAGEVARTSLELNVPALKPVLNVERDTTASGERLLITGRVQTADQPSIVVRVGDRELSRTHEPIAEVAVPRNSKVSVELLAGDKVVLSDAIQSGGLFATLTTPFVAAMAALVAIGAPLVWRRKRSLDPSAAVTRALQPANVQPSRHVVPLAAASQAPEQMTNIIVRTPEGNVRRILVRRGAALTIGTDTTCDIRLTDESVRSRHGMLTRLEDGHFELHPITGQAEEDARLAIAGRVLLRPGDPVRIGQHVLVIE